MKLWAMVHDGDRIVADTLYETEGGLDKKQYPKMLQDIAYALDIATPVTLDTHFEHLRRFNRVKYLPRDFIEEVDFSFLVLETVKEESKRPPRVIGGWSIDKDKF